MDYYKPGSIKLVKLHNFLTYADVEFCPGPRLNVVVGPNGTGKSTLLCAICLGLGGQPALLGRADDARTFIMHEKDLATIEIELAPHPSSEDDPNNLGFKPPHVFKRVIDRSLGAEHGRGLGASKYYINDRPTNIKTVKELVQNVYQIQIDNLCTFLPQDKVGSFSGFNPQQLLIETEKALLLKWYDTHQKLISLEEEIQRDGTDKETIEDRLDRLQKDNEAIEREKELVEQRQEAQALKHKLEQKKAWVLFDDARQRAVELKTLKEDCKKALQKAREGLAPYEQEHETIQRDIGRMQSRTAALTREAESSKQSYDKSMQKMDRFHDEIEEIIGQINGMDSMQRSAERKVQQQEARVEEVKEQLAQFPPEEEMKQRSEDLVKELRTYKQQLDRAKKELNSVTGKQRELTGKGEALSQKLARINDDKARRAERIFRQYPELAETFKWIDQNRKLFRRPVHGPIACEVEITSKSTAAYLEQHVANATWKQYVTECQEDYNLLYRELRQKRNMHVNIHIVAQGKCESVYQPYSDEKMQLLKDEHGVSGFLDDSFTAPPAIVQALRTQHNVHSVLVGSQKSHVSLDRGLSKLLETPENGDRRLMPFCIFSCTQDKAFKTTSVVSRYCGQSGLRVDEVSAARILAPGDSSQQKEALNQQLQQIRDQLAELEPMLCTVQQESDSILKKAQQVNEQLHEAKRALNDYQSVKMRMSTADRKLEEYREAASRDNIVEKENAIRNMKKHVQNCTKALVAAGESHEALMKATYSTSAVKMQEDCLAAKAEKIQNKLAEQRIATLNLEREMNDITRNFNNAKEELKHLKIQAERIAPMQDASGNVLSLKEELEKLPATLEEIEAALGEANHKINSIADNPEVVRQYEKRLREIAQIKEDIAGRSELQDAKKAELESQFNPWQAALKNTVHKVNVLFGKYMEELGMAGEVRLAKGPASGDEAAGNFKDWGIEILVKFREKAQLQVLSAQVHSGGERSVSTIMYLMALQELMSAPFRCVDEINQGLDERNERLVFKRIVSNSTRTPQENGALHGHSGQYFLITPKLLPNMTDMEREDVTILCIFNGPYNFEHFLDWKVDRFLSKKRARVDAEGSAEVEQSETEGSTEVDKENSENDNVERRTVPRKHRLS